MRTPPYATKSLYNKHLTSKLNQDIRGKNTSHILENVNVHELIVSTAYCVTISTSGFIERQPNQIEQYL